MLQFVVVCCSALQCVVAWCSMHAKWMLLMSVVFRDSERNTVQCVAECCSVLQCVAVCCNMHPIWMLLVRVFSFATARASETRAVAKGTHILHCLETTQQDNERPCKTMQRKSMQDNAMSCIVLLCGIAVCYRVLQCAAVCCRALSCVAVCCTVSLQCIAVCCGVLQCDAVCCSVLQFGAVCCNTF